MNSFFRRQPRIEAESPGLSDCDFEAQIQNNHQRATGDTNVRRDIKTRTWTATRDGETVQIQPEAD